MQRVYPASSRRQAGRDANADSQNTDIKNTNARPMAGCICPTSDVLLSFFFLLLVSLYLSVFVYINIYPGNIAISLGIYEFLIIAT